MDSWQSIAAKKRSDILAKIPVEWLINILPEEHQAQAIAGKYIESLLDIATVHITSRDAADLIMLMSQGKLTATESRHCSPTSPLLLEINFDAALERAGELDEYFRTHHKLIGPLHGLPVTLKDQFHIKGLDTSVGYVGWIGNAHGKADTGKPHNTESQLVLDLYALGAVPISKSTLAQAAFASETDNNILGYLHLPLAPHGRLSASGSSGGEGVMQALRGSAFGIGTDIGGSVTMPAASNGIFGLKPSTGRALSTRNAAETGAPNLVIASVPGVMTASLQTVRLVLKALVDIRPWERDPALVPIPWRTELEFPRLQNPHDVVDGEKTREKKHMLPTFAIVDSDPHISLHPPIARAFRMVRQALAKDGIQVINWDGPNTNDCQRFHAPITSASAFVDIYHALALSNEPPMYNYSQALPSAQEPPPPDFPTYHKGSATLLKYRENLLDYWMSTADQTENGQPIDALIMPIFESAGKIPRGTKYTSYPLFPNLLGYPTVAIPVTTADQNIDTVPANFTPLSQRDQENMASYDAEKYHGAAAGIQILARSFEDEKLLSLAQIVMDSLSRLDDMGKVN